MMTREELASALLSDFPEDAVRLAGKAVGAPNYWNRKIDDLRLELSEGLDGDTHAVILETLDLEGVGYGAGEEEESDAEVAPEEVLAEKTEVLTNSAYSACAQLNRDPLLREACLALDSGLEKVPDGESVEVKSLYQWVRGVSTRLSSIPDEALRPLFWVSLGLISDVYAPQGVVQEGAWIVVRGRPLFRLGWHLDRVRELRTRVRYANLASGIYARALSNRAIVGGDAVPQQEEA